ncbi:hypothetical protein ISN76_18390 [Dyella halodurans]|uniref:Uncharacterized protein n=1 Tax=Dyella halodurans TaxID=1920171 RepID=A0ABV9C843_9GAMM|nr:hypothetical protein [Dyella halodurans]
MSSLWTDLLFMHGYISNAELARRLAETPKSDQKPSGKRERSNRQAASEGSARPALVAGDCLPT